MCNIRMVICASTTHLFVLSVLLGAKTRKEMFEQKWLFHLHINTYYVFSKGHKCVHWKCTTMISDSDNNISGYYVQLGEN